MRHRLFRTFAASTFLVILASFSSTTPAQTPKFTLAGFAYSGDAASMASRFPLSAKYEQSLKAQGTSAHAKVMASVAATPPQHLELTTGQIEELKGRDQALVVALVVTSETVSVEQFGALHKLFVLVRGQSVFFDFKSMTVVRAYPLSFAVIDVFDHPPTEAETVARLTRVYEGSQGKPGLFARFAASVATASVPTNVPRFVQVTNVTFKPEALAQLPDYLKNAPGVAEIWAADMISESLSTRVGIPMVPYAKGYAIGKVMPMRVADGTVYELKLPTPDYQVSLEMSALKKIKYSDVAAGTSFIYGAFATVRVEEPLTGTVYMNTALKNGEVKVVPATQNYVDDFPAFYDSVNGLFSKLGEAVAGKGNGWVKTAAAAPDIELQINKTREVLNQCK